MNKHFGMITWVSHETGGAEHSHFKDGQRLSAKDLLSCGTKACALGWAASMPYFQKLGLTLHYGGYGGIVAWKGDRKTGPRVFNVAEKAFDIDEQDATHLFRDIEARSPREWANKAKKYLARV